MLIKHNFDDFTDTCHIMADDLFLKYAVDCESDNTLRSGQVVVVGTHAELLEDLGINITSNQTTYRSYCIIEDDDYNDEDYYITNYESGEEKGIL